MSQNKWKVTKLSDLLGVMTMGFMAIALAKCSIETISLITNYDYAIAHVVKEYKGAKMERKIIYKYSVKGESYTSGAEWSESIRTGDRFIIRYGKFAPKGNKPIYDLPLPDSITQDTGRVWRNFLSIHNL